MSIQKSNIIVKCSSDDLQYFKLVHEHYRQDLRQFMVRTNFYLVIQTAFVVTFFSKKVNIDFLLIDAEFILVSVALLISILWLIVCKSSIKWLKKWRKQVCRLDLIVSDFKCFESQEIPFEKRRWYNSPTITISFISILFLTLWVLLFFNKIIRFYI